MRHAHRSAVTFPITYKLALFTLAVTALAITAVSIGYYLDTEDVLRNKILADFSALTHARAEQITTLIALDTEIAKSIASRRLPRDYLAAKTAGNPDVSRQLARAKNSLVDAMQAMPRISRIDISDTKGFVVASTDEKGIGKNLLDTEGFKKGREAPYISAPYPVKGKVSYDIFAPLADTDASVKTAAGVMRCSISAQDIVDVLLDRANLGETGEYTLARVEGDKISFLNTLRFTPDAPLPYQVALDSHLAEPMRRALRGENGVMQGIDYRGKKVLAAYEYIPALKWALVTKIDTTEAFAPFRRLLTNTIFIAILTLMIAMVFVAFFSAFITRPIHALHEATERIGAGDLDFRIGTGGDDEIGQLARSFDTMVKNLKRVTASRTELVDALAVRNSFVSTVSHELRTPLAAIKGSIDVVAGNMVGIVNEKQRKYLEMAKKNVDRLDRLIGGILDFRKMESGRLQYAMQEEACNEIISEIHDTMLPSVAAKDLAFPLHLSADIPRVVCDRDRIIQVLVNLINNAMAFTHHGSISIETKTIDGFIRISVTDTGEGIQPGDIHKLFQPFTQIKRRPGGTGLGLTISKEIVEAHGGTIGAESVYGTGTTIYFTLPIKKAEA